MQSSYKKQFISTGCFKIVKMLSKAFLYLLDFEVIRTPRKQCLTSQELNSEWLLSPVWSQHVANMARTWTDLKAMLGPGRCLATSWDQNELASNQLGVNVGHLGPNPCPENMQNSKFSYMLCGCYMILYGFHMIIFFLLIIIIIVIIITILEVGIAILYEYASG